MNLSNENIKITYRHKKPGISMRITKEGNISVSASFGTSRQRIIDFIQSNSLWIEQARQRQCQRQQRRQSFFDQLPLDTNAQAHTAIAQLHAIVVPLLDKHQPSMGVQASGISYRRMRTRWGSCNVRTRHISLSIYLLLLPQWCIEHVVVHELAHLLVPNHSAAFYSIMNLHFPQWQLARRETRRLSNLEI